MSSIQSIETPQDYVNYTFNLTSRGVTEVTSELTGMSSTVSNLVGLMAFKTSEYLSNTEAMLVGFGYAAAATFTTATQQAIRFEQALADVKAIGGETTDAFAIGQAAMKYSNQFGMNVDAMTEGLEALSRAGLTATNVMSGILEEGVKLSKLEGMDLEDSINNLISTTNLLAEGGYDVNSQDYADMVKAMNQHIVSTSESAPINAQNIIQTLQHVGGYASANKIDQDDLFAVIAQLGSKGTKGEMAGTALRAFIAAGQKDQAQRALKRIGLEPSDLWDDTGDAMLPVSKMKALLDDALEARGYSQQEKLEFYSDFAGYKQANQIMKINVDEVQNYKENIAQAWDLGTKLDTILGTVHSNIQIISQTVKNFMTRVGNTILPILNAVLQPIKWVVQLIDAMPFSEQIVGMGLTFLALKGLFVGVNRVIPAIASLYTSFNKQEKQVKGIRGHFKNLLNDAKEFKETIEHIKDPEWNATKRMQNDKSGMGAVEHSRAVAQIMYDSLKGKDITGKAYDELSKYEQNNFIELVASLGQDKELYQSIVNQIDERSLALRDAIINLQSLPTEEVTKDIPLKTTTSNRDKNAKTAEKRAGMKETFDEVKKNNQLSEENTKTLKNTLNTIQELKQYIRSQTDIGTNQYDIGRGIMSVARPFSEILVDTYFRRINKKDFETKAGTIKFDSDIGVQATKEIDNIFDTVRKHASDLPDISFYYNDDIGEMKTKAQSLVNDIQNVAEVFSNVDFNNMHWYQGTRALKTVDVKAMGKIGLNYSEMMNEAYIREVLNQTKFDKNNKFIEHIYDEQINLLAESLDVDVSRITDKTEKLQKIYNKFRSKDNNKSIDDVVASSTKWYHNTLQDRVNPSEYAAKWLNNDASRFIMDKLNIRYDVNNSDMNQQLIEGIKHVDLETKWVAKQLIFALQKNQAPGIYSGPETDELTSMVTHLQALIKSIDKLETSVSDSIEPVQNDNIKTPERFLTSHPAIKQSLENSTSTYKWDIIPSIENAQDRVKDLLQNGDIRIDNNIPVSGLNRKGDIRLKDFSDNNVNKFFNELIHELSHGALNHTLRGDEARKNLELKQQLVNSGLYIPQAKTQEGASFGKPIAELEADLVAQKVLGTLGLDTSFSDNRIKKLENIIISEFGNLDMINYDLINSTANAMLANTPVLADIVAKLSRDSTGLAQNYKTALLMQTLKSFNAVEPSDDDTNNGQGTFPGISEQDYKILGDIRDYNDSGTAVVFPEDLTVKLDDDEVFTNIKENVQKIHDFLTQSEGTKELVPLSQPQNNTYNFNGNVTIVMNGDEKGTIKDFINTQGKVVDNENKPALEQYSQTKKSTKEQPVVSDDEDTQQNLTNAIKLLDKEADHLSRRALATNFWNSIERIEKEFYESMENLANSIALFNKTSEQLEKDAFWYEQQLIEDNAVKDIQKRNAKKSLENIKEQSHAKGIYNEPNKEKKPSKGGYKSYEDEDEVIIGSYRVPNPEDPFDDIPENLMPRGYPQELKDQLHENTINRIAQQDTDAQAQRLARAKAKSDGEAMAQDLLNVAHSMYVETSKRHAINPNTVTDDELDFIGLNKERDDKRRKKRDSEVTDEDLEKARTGVAWSEYEKLKAEKEKENQKRLSQGATKEDVRLGHKRPSLDDIYGIPSQYDEPIGPEPHQPTGKEMAAKVLGKTVEDIDKMEENRRLKQLVAFVDRTLVDEEEPYVPSMLQEGMGTAISQGKRMYEFTEAYSELLLVASNIQQEVNDAKEDELKAVKEHIQQTKDNIENTKEEIRIKELRRKFETGLYELTDEELELIGEGKHSKKPNSKIRADALQAERQQEQQEKNIEDAKAHASDISGLYDSEKPNIGDYQEKVKEDNEKQRQIEENKHIAQQEISKYSGGYDAENIIDLDYYQEKIQKEFYREKEPWKLDSDDFWNEMDKLEKQGNNERQEKIREQQERIWAQQQEMQIQGIEAQTELLNVAKNITEEEERKKEEHVAREDLKYLFGEESLEHKKQRYSQRLEELEGKDTLTPEERVEKLGLQGRSFLSNLLINQANKLPEDTHRLQYSNKFADTADKIDAMTAPLYRFNDALFKAGEIFPPLTVAAYGLQGALSLVTMVTDGLRFAQEAYAFVAGLLGLTIDEQAASEGVLTAAKYGNIVANWLEIGAEEDNAASKLIGAGVAYLQAGGEELLSAVRLIGLGPLLIIIAAVAALIAIVYVSEKMHAEALKESQKQLEESNKSIKLATARYKSMRNARVSEMDATRKHMAAIKESVALKKLESERYKQDSIIRKKNRLETDPIWGENNSLRTQIQTKQGLGGLLAYLSPITMLAAGEYESIADKHAENTYQTRSIVDDANRNHPLTNLITGYDNQYARQVERFYSAHSLDFAYMDAYAPELENLYGLESKLQKVYGEEGARDSPEFLRAMQEVADSTGLSGEQLGQYLDYMQVEANVENARTVASAGFGDIFAETQKEVNKILYPDQEGMGDLDNEENAMVWAAVEEEARKAKEEMFQQGVMEYLAAITALLDPRQWGDIDNHIKAGNKWLTDMTNIDQNKQRIAEDALEVAEADLRKDYGTEVYSYYGDTPFGGAVASAHAAGMSVPHSSSSSVNTQSSTVSSTTANVKSNQNKAKQLLSSSSQNTSDNIASTFSQDKDTGSLVFDIVDKALGFAKDYNPISMALDAIFSKDESSTTPETPQVNKYEIHVNTININTEDDPEKIKTAFMNLMIEMSEQVTPRQVSRTIGQQKTMENSNIVEGTDLNINANNNTNNNPM